MIEIIDLQDDLWTGETFKSKKELRDFLASDCCYRSGYSDEEYYKVNAHASLDEYCEMFEIKYVEKS